MGRISRKQLTACFRASPGKGNQRTWRKTLPLTLRIVSLCLMVHTKVTKQIDIKMRAIAIDSIPSLTLVFGFCAFQAAVYLSALGQDRLTFWLLYAALLPLGAAFIPLALIVTIHLPLSSTIACTQHMCQQQQHGTGDQVEPLGTVTIRDIYFMSFEHGELDGKCSLIGCMITCLFCACCWVALHMRSNVVYIACPCL